MPYDLKPLSKSLADIADWLSREFDGIRTGRAAPAILDSVKVEAYGSFMPLNQVASVSVEGPRMLRVSPWDQAMIKPIEKAMSDADLGVSCATDERGIRVSFPELTSERRVQLTRLAREKLEQARVSVRKARDDAWSGIQKDEKEGVLSEDDKFRSKDEMQKLVDAANAKLEEMTKKKEVELAE